MVRPDTTNWLAMLMAAALSCAVVGCPDDDPVPAGPVTPVDDDAPADDDDVGTPPYPISAKATVKFKTVERLVNDFTQALDLDLPELCNELGLYACSSVHAIALGSTDAYGAGVYEPLAESAVSTPIAVDRIAMSGCLKRAHADVTEPAGAVIFKDLDIASGALVDVEAQSVGDAIDRLYKRALLRTPKPDEVDHMRQLYRDLEEGGSQEPARDWATLSCYSVLTTMESLFY